MKCRLPFEIALLFCGLVSFAQTTPSSTDQKPESPAADARWTGGKFFSVGGDVSAPKAVYRPDPEYSEEARKANYGGTCILWLVVGADGLPYGVRVARSLGHGLDEKAIEAVKKWKFEPALKDGKPVPVQINVEVSFSIKRPLSIGPLDVLSDTMGVDFGPYLARVLHDVRENWFRIIPASARAPEMKKGKVSIEFAILKDGKISGLQIVGSSGDVALDRGAYGGITASKPFPPLPSEFGGQYLALRFHFFYNPSPADLREPAATRITISPASAQVISGTTQQFSATVITLKGNVNTTVNWSVVGTGCVGAACGTISATGLYATPPNVPNPPTVRVIGVLAADPNQTASAPVNIVQPTQSH